MKTQQKAKDILFPVPAALVVSGVGDDANIITVAWIGIVGSNPPALGISLHKNRYTLLLIRETQEFTANIPRQSDFAKVDYCGIVSGKTLNKFNATNFTKMDGCKVNVPIIKECPLNIECRVLREVDLQDWILIIGEILEVNLDADCLDEDGKVAIKKVDPLIYIPTIREYWNIAEKLADSFNVGKDYKKSIE